MTLCQEHSVPEVCLQTQIVSLSAEAAAAEFVKPPIMSKCENSTGSVVRISVEIKKIFDMLEILAF